MRKQLGALFISATILTSCITPFWGSITANALTFEQAEEHPDFNMDIYCATLLSNPDTPGGYSSMMYKNLNGYLYDIKMPTEILYTNLSHDAGFVTSVGAWNIFSFIFEPGGAVSDMVNQQEYYETVILHSITGYLHSAVYDDNAFMKDCLEFNKDFYNDFSDWHKTYFALNELGRTDFDSMTTGQRNAYFNAFVENFGGEDGLLDRKYNAKYPNAELADDIMQAYSDILTLGINFEEAMHKAAVYAYCCNSLKGELMQVINDLYDNCSAIEHPTMKAALLKVKTACSGIAGATLMTEADMLIGDLSYMAESIINNFVCEMWVSGGYSAPLFVGYKAGKALSNALYATDDTIAQFCKMGALSDYEWLIKRTVEMERSKFNADSSDYNAKVLLNSIEVMYNVLDLSCDFAIAFSDIIYEGGAINIFGQNDQKHADFVNSCNKMRSYARESYNRFNDLYLLELEGDYPDVFASLVKQKDFYAHYVPVTGIEWDIDDIEVGLEDTYVLFFNAKVVPDNATNKEIIYSSSNPEVAICSSAGIDYFQPGTAVITASTLEGDYSESITVNVVEGHGVNGIVLEPTIIKEPVIGDVFEFEGVKYTITSSTEVTVSGRTSTPSNYMNIPKKVTYQEKEYKVTAISNYAFYNDSTLLYVIMPDTIETIGSYAFNNCYNLKSVRLSSKITRVSRDCFYCSGIETLIVPEGVTSIGIESFSLSASLKTIYLPSTLESIEDGAFFRCQNLENVFYAGSQDELKKVSLGILNSPLNSASCIYNATFPSRDIVSSGKCGESATYSLTYDGILSIEGSGDMGGWTSSISYDGGQYVVKYNLPWIYFGDIITNLHIDKGITNIPNSIFSAGTIVSIEVDESNPNYTSIEGVLFDKSVKTLLQYPNGKKNHVYFVPDGVNEIGSLAIVNNSNLSNLIFPDGVTTISSSSIQNCPNLKNITIPSTLNNIESGSFSKISDYRLILSEGFTELTKEYIANFSKMSSVIIPDSVIQIEDETFYNFSKLTEVRMGNGVNILGDGVFVNCSNLKSVKLSQSLSDISYSTFYGCTNLNNVYIPNSVKSIGKAAFYNCTSLSNVNLGQNLVSIGSSAFYGCTSLMNIYLPDSLNTIDNWAFQYCAFKSITIPQNVTSIGNYVFSYCANLNDIEVDQKNNYYSSAGGMLYNKTQTELLQVPNGKELISYRVPSNITKIGKGAFNHCNRLETIIIPFTDIVIDTYAFNECDSLTDVYYEGSRAEWNALEILENNTALKSAEVHYNFRTLAGDINLDGEFSVADVVILQKWLLAQPDINLADWKAADLCEDNKLDVFDLCLMKRKLING